MKSSNRSNPYGRKFFIYTGLFLLVSLLQASFTELAGDEAYYWEYSQQLDWGYFDHPPFVALIIKIAYTLFEGELGVRFISILFGTASIFMLWHLTDKSLRQKPFAVDLFFLLWFSLPVFNIYSFITVPDSPLLFFALLYIYTLKKFKAGNSIKYMLILALVMALMLYSKYHGIVLIFITIIADYKLLKNPKFYLASMIGALIFLPHLIWQFQHDFPSIKYHFFERNLGFSFKYIFEYPLNVLIILNPLLASLFIFKNFKHKKETDKNLRFIFWGFIIFFTFSALKSHVEPHWVGISTIPLMIMLFNLSGKYEKIRKTVKIFSLISIVLLAFGRFALVFDILPIKTEFHKTDELAKKIANKAGDLPVLMLNSYTRAAKYHFYTGKPAFAYNSIHYRKNQFTYWNYEDSLKGHSIFFVSNYQGKGFKDSIQENYYYRIIENYQPSKKLRFYPENMPEKLSTVDTFKMKAVFINPYNFDIHTKGKQTLKPYFALKKNKKMLQSAELKSNLPEVISARDSISFDIRLSIKDIEAGDYTMLFALEPHGLYPRFSSPFYKIELSEDGK